MRLELDCPVDCADGPFGKLADVVVDPAGRRVTHLVVEPPRRHGLARLVPIELARSDDAPGRIKVLRTVAELRRLPAVEHFAYVRLDELPLEDPDWDVGIETVLAHLDHDFTRYGGPPPGYEPHLAVVYDRVPKGEVEVRRASIVLSADRHLLGRVEGVRVDPDGVITDLVLERGHLFGRREVTIPVGSVARFATDSITLGLTRDEVAGLPSVRAGR